MSHAIVLMTALVPTYGHKALIDFASGIADQVTVIVSGRSFEPISLRDRIDALRQVYFGRSHIKIISHNDDKAPQNPSEHPDFWDWWKDTILGFVIQDVDYVVASEHYGHYVADSLNATFIPFDINREILNDRGTKIRDFVYKEENWNRILPDFRPKIKFRYCLFGQESVGKTTIGKMLGEDPRIQFVPEWARIYLETVGSEITEEKMMNIVKGQYSTQKVAYYLHDKPIVIHDTDLLSTIGYYRIMGYEIPYELISKFTIDRIKSRMKYFLLPDDVPFEKDILRYGGNIRQSSYNFWKDLLEEFRCDYWEVPRNTLNTKVDFIEAKMYYEINDRETEIAEFVRT